MGLLQFRTRHNLDTDACLATNDCFLELEDEGDTVGWLSKVATVSDLAVLHWDRAIPWGVFRETPAPGVDRVVFYDQRLDSVLARWVDAFEAHFERMERGFVAVSLLHGERNRLEQSRVRDGLEVETATVCDPIEPGVEIEYAYQDGTTTTTVTFDLETSYRNLLLYLYDKLNPDHFAIMVEANLFKETCPARWDGLVRLYASLYDSLRAHVATNTTLFATLTLPDLLAHDFDTCTGGLRGVACTEPDPPDDYPAPSLQRCYPLDRSALSDLDRGDRLDVLALSFYPDALLMQPPETARGLVRTYPPDWDEVSLCETKAGLAPFIDPYAQIDRLGWTKPIAIAESSSRSCPTAIQLDFPPGSVVVRLPGDPTYQAFWLDRMLSTAESRGDVLFVTNSFLNDYPPLGLWLVQQGILSPFIFSLFNTWPCSGLSTYEGSPKAVAQERWLRALSR